MQGLDSGKDKVKKICEVLRKETLEPAIKEAEEIVENARLEAEKLLEKAKKKIAKMKEDAELEIQKKQEVFQASLSQACRQTLETLRQQIEEKLFSKKLSELISNQTSNPKVLSELITAVVEAVREKGMEADLSVVIPSVVPAREVNVLLAKEIADSLKEKSVLLGPITGGIEVKLHKQNMTIDMTDSALKELLSNYIRKDFRELFFEI